MKLSKLIAAAALVAATSAPAAVIVSNLPAFSGNGAIGSQSVGMFTFVIPVGDVITGVVFTGQTGNAAASTTAPLGLTLDGVTVLTCVMTDNCTTNGPVPIAYFFSAPDFGLFADGSAALVAAQTGCCIVRLGASTLTVFTESAGVPEPTTWSLLIAGFAMAGSSMRRRRVVAIA